MDAYAVADRILHLKLELILLKAINYLSFANIVDCRSNGPANGPDEHHAGYPVAVASGKLPPACSYGRAEINDW